MSVAKIGVMCAKLWGRQQGCFDDMLCFISMILASRFNSLYLNVAKAHKGGMTQHIRMNRLHRGSWQWNRPTR